MVCYKFCFPAMYEHRNEVIFLKAINYKDYTHLFKTLYVIPVYMCMCVCVYEGCP